MSDKLNFCSKHGTSYVHECHSCYRETTKCDHGVAFDGECEQCKNEKDGEMSIEVGSKWKHKESREVVEVKEYEDIRKTCRSIVWFYKNGDNYEHCLTEADFLEQYKPYEPIY